MEEMISYYQLKKNKIRDVPKLGRNWAEIFSKLTKIGKKNRYYVHFENKKYTKNIKQRDSG